MPYKVNDQINVYFRVQVVATRKKSQRAADSDRAVRLTQTDDLPTKADYKPIFDNLVKNSKKGFMK